MVFVSDEAVAPRKPVLLPGSEFTMLWGDDETPQLPDNGAMPNWHTYFPPIGGSRFSMFTLPPGTAEARTDNLSTEEAVADGEAKLPGLLGYMELDDPGVLDDGAKVTLNPGEPSCRTAPGTGGRTRVTPRHVLRCSPVGRPTTRSAAHSCREPADFVRTVPGGDGVVGVALQCA